MVCFTHGQQLGAGVSRRLSNQDAAILAASWGAPDLGAAVEAARRPDGRLSGEVVARNEFEHLLGDTRQEWISAWSDCSGHPDLTGSWQY